MLSMARALSLGAEFIPRQADASQTSDTPSALPVASQVVPLAIFAYRIARVIVSLSIAANMEYPQRV